MRPIKIWMTGSITGSGTSLLFFLASLILSIDGELTLPEFGIALLSPTIVATLVTKITHSKMLLSLTVAYLTLVIPTIPALLGAPNQDVKVAVTLAILGLVGGLVWSTPFALWAYFKKRKVD